ncbi:MAG: hypothetical protein IIY44_03190 [Erysipelotrichales bacterium]|nr:hypothetical protein [Erysipelotrichales bacterium]MBQ1385948.1 hypothetical protein [Erysipelotrichales bacterium]MBQ2310038.1 hypothetical protein [Erysipelotrichales bacterium]MBQ2478143.1 hypothetical protein [Erysipelotrichales bacterium]MBQ4375471.1 hypothetical protein [Erysipelotrichales bacterium]
MAEGRYKPFEKDGKSVRISTYPMKRKIGGTTGKRKLKWCKADRKTGERHP